MITQGLISALRDRLYYVSDTVGGVESLINFISQRCNSSEELELRLYLLLSHPGDVVVVSPWAPRFNLYDLENPIIANLYSTHDINGNLIYKVEANDVWGNSILDKALVLQSLTGELFYVCFAGINGPNKILVLINNTELRTASAISSKSTLKAPLLDIPYEPADNKIELYSDVRINELEILFLAASPRQIPTMADMLQTATRTTYSSIDSDEVITYHPNRSGWLSIIYRNTPVSLSDVLGEGVDRFVALNTHTYYVAIGKEINTQLVRESMGLATRRPIGFSTKDTLSIKARMNI
jgi:hypothetical protein